MSMDNKTYSQFLKNASKDSYYVSTRKSEDAEDAKDNKMHRDKGIPSWSLEFTVHLPQLDRCLT